MFRFSIARLMYVIGVIALGAAALRNASDLWVGMVLLATVGLLGFALIGIAYRRESKRAWWFGFALFGWGYLVMALGPWFAQEIAPRLPTARLLTYLHEKVRPPDQAAFLDLSMIMGGQGSALTSSGALTLQPVMTTGGSGPMPGVPGWTGTPLTITSTPPATNATQAGAFTVNLLLATTGNQEQFVRIGHCLFALLAGLIGAAIARWFYGSQKQLDAVRQNSG